MRSCKKIQKLNVLVSDKLQSQVTIISYGAAVRELIQNSIDADAKEITLRLDLQSLGICVEDDGSGIMPEDLDKIGQRYYTSKLDRLEDLKEVRTFGFRGESLHSIRSISNLSIISKHGCSTHPFKLSCNVNRKLSLYDFKDELDNPLKQNYFHLEPFRGSGTIVIATNLFYNTPVRRDQFTQLPEYKVIEDIRVALVQTLVRHPEVKIKMYKVDHRLKQLTPLVLINKQKIPPFVPLEEKYACILKSVYGSSVLPSYETISASFVNYKLSGVIGTKPAQTKRYQYIFVNGSPLILSGDDSRIINKVFSNADFGVEVPRYKSPKLNSPSRALLPNRITTSVGKPFSKFPVFIINVECPVIIEDLIQDPSKHIYHSSHWSTINKIVQKVFGAFLRMQGYDTIFKCLPPSLSPTASPPPQKLQNLHRVLPATFTELSPKQVLNSNEKSTLNGLAGIDEIARLSEKIEPPSNGERDKITKYQVSRRIRSNLSNFKHHSYCDNQYLDILKINVPTDESEYFTKLDEYHISKQDFKMDNCRVIKQIDKKFILLTMSICKAAEADKSSALMVLDQHACDERIRVENLFKEFISQVINPQIDLQIKLIDPFVIPISNKESDLFEQFRSNFYLFGIVYELSDDMLTVTHLPYILIEKVNRDMNFLKSCLFQHVYDLENHIKQANLHSSTLDWFYMVTHLPRVIIDLIVSKACRSSIMFGDALTFAEMQHLIVDLSKCHLPYQCAHGRPSIIPLVNLGKHNEICSLSK